MISNVVYNRISDIQSLSTSVSEPLLSEREAMGPEIPNPWENVLVDQGLGWLSGGERMAQRKAEGEHWGDWSAPAGGPSGSLSVKERSWGLALRTVEIVGHGCG